MSWSCSTSDNPPGDLCLEVCSRQSADFIAFVTLSLLFLIQSYTDELFIQSKKFHLFSDSIDFLTHYIAKVTLKTIINKNKTKNNESQAPQFQHEKNLEKNPSH